MTPMRKLATLEAKVAQLENLMKTASPESIAKNLGEIIEDGTELLVSLVKAQKMYKYTLTSMLLNLEKTTKASYALMKDEHSLSMNHNEAMGHSFSNHSHAITNEVKKALHEEKQNWDALSQPLSTILNLLHTVHKEANMFKGPQGFGGGFGGEYEM